MLPLSILFDRDGGIRMQASLPKPGENCAAPLVQRIRLDSVARKENPITMITYYHIGVAGMYELYEEA